MIKMELWIRSQNKEKLISNCSFLIKDWGDKCWIECIIHKERLILGIYKTKERALEVLDEIQEKISVYSNARVIVYEMPAK